MKKKALIYSITIVIIWRIVTSGLLFILAQTLSVDPIPLIPEHLKMYNALKAGSFFDRNFLLPWFRWDTFQYAYIATNGYVEQFYSVWPPLFPLLIGVLTTTGLHPLTASLCISTIATIAVLYNFYLLVEEEGLCSPRLALFYLLTFPVAFYFLAGYSESLFLALTLICLRQARKGNLMIAGLVAVLATLTRQIGILLSIPLFIETLRHTGFSFKSISVRKLLPAAGYAILPFIGFALFSLYVHIGLGYGFVWKSIDLYGKRQLVFPGWAMVMAVIDILKGKTILNPFSMAVDVLLCLIACVIFLQGIKHRKEMPLSFLVFYLANLLVILMYVIDEKPLVSASRYLLVVFPIFILQAQRWKDKWVRISWFTFSLVCGILMFTGFYAWMWVE